MPNIRTGRRKYYNIFSHFYDAFIKLHSRRYQGGTRDFIAETANIQMQNHSILLDVCCGTGSVALTLKQKYPASLVIGYDFSRGMLKRAKLKAVDAPAVFIEGDAANLPFHEKSIDAITCSHALYEFKNEGCENALMEMRRVLKPGAPALIMEHAVPNKWYVKIFFFLRLFVIGSPFAKKIAAGDIGIFKKFFGNVSIAAPPSEKSRLFICRG